MTTTRTTTSRLGYFAAATAFGVASLTGLAACSDEDDDGGTTDEEIQDGQDTADSVEGEVEEEVDAQTEGDDEDGE
jgi:hypothetical protein